MNPPSGKAPIARRLAHVEPPNVIQGDVTPPVIVAVEGSTNGAVCTLT
jgi:hypothetical protein